MSKKNLIKKARTIAKAFSEPLPEDEEWFQERLRICGECAHNSKNIDSDNLSTTDKILLKTVCSQDQNCTICHCCIPEKLSQKGEECGLADIGEPPKWVALEVESIKDKKIMVENLTPETGKLQTEEGDVVYDLGESSDERINFSLIITRKGGFDLKSVGVGCKCTVADSVKLSEDSYRFDIILTTKDFKVGSDIKRTFTAHYYSSSSKVSKATVKIKLKKK